MPLPIQFHFEKIHLSNQCCGQGCLSRIRIFSVPIRIKEFKYFNPKNGFQALGNMIRVVHTEPNPGSGS